MNIKRLLTALAITAATIGGGANATAQTPPTLYTELPSLSCPAAGRYLHDYYFAPKDLDYSLSALLVGASVWNKGCMSYDITASSQSGYSRARNFPNAAATFKARYGIRDTFGYSPPYTIKVNVPSSCRYSVPLSLWYGC